MKKEKYTTEISGKTLTVEFNDLAEQADGSVMVSYGNTTVLATVAMSDEPSNANFFPLIVDYEEKFYAAGQILGSRFMRREGRPSDDAVLSARLIDRTIRPLFDKSIRNEVQVVITVLSIAEDDPDVLAMLATSIALSTSRIPWDGPVSALRIGKHKGEENYKINPEYGFRSDENNELDLVVCGKGGKVTMLEAEAKETSREDLLKAVNHAKEDLEKLQNFQKEVIEKKVVEKETIEKPSISSEIKDLFTKEIEPKLKEAAFTNTPGKEKVEKLKKEWKNLASEELPEEDSSEISDYFEEQLNLLIHKEAVNNKKRPDGRSVDELRPLYAQAGGVSEVLHGSGIFYRGGTHVLSVLTLGGPNDALLVDQIESQDVQKRFMHHYNFPPFSVGETGRIGGFNRRMIGHGSLAEKALKAVIPPKEEFPYTIRLVSEALSSNGSTSMASICGSTLALMDGGVPIKAPVAGIAMGLMVAENDHVVLTDIQGPEDHYGDMDFKLAGTRNGITALQMDTKLSGIPMEIIEKAVSKSKEVLEKILDTIEEEIKEPRQSISPHAPEIRTISIQKEQIGLVIGPGGKTINEIKNVTGADIDIEDDGTVYIISSKGGGAEQAKKMIEEMTHEYKKGEVFKGEVVKITEFGAFVKIGPGTEGLVHISEIAPSRIEKVEDVLSVGDEVPIIIKDIDEKERLKLSIKEVDPDFTSNNKNANGGSKKQQG
ncbi:MAG: polyribonucleotide nucleotidyltransferase [Candidatus Paceibacterota bacterium]